MRKLLLVLILLSSACASEPSRPDLARLYANQADPAAAVPVVVVHGIMGGRLVNQTNGNETWPGSLRRILFDDYRALQLDVSRPNVMPIASDLAVDGITDRAAGKDFYGRIISVLQDAGNYELTTPGSPAQGNRRRLYVYAYDWRQDNVHSARGLHALIEQIRRDHEQPDMQVDVVAHSMGGLITRYYARYGTADVLDDNEFPVNNEGAQRLRRVILLGTPNFGSVVAADILDKGLRVGFDTVAPEVIATFPSAYQVLPHALNDWVHAVDGEHLEIDIFDVDFWRDSQLAVFNPEVRRRVSAASGADYLALLDKFFHRSLERARRFTWSLTVTLQDTPIRYVVFGGDCSLTPTRMVLEGSGASSHLRLEPGHIRNRIRGVDYERLMLEPGDGTVSKASLLARQSSDPTIARHRYSFFPLRYAFFLCVEHQSLTGNISFQDNLLNALLSADPL